MGMERTKNSSEMVEHLNLSQWKEAKSTSTNTLSINRRSSTTSRTFSIWKNPNEMNQIKENLIKEILEKLNPLASQEVQLDQAARFRIGGPIRYSLEQSFQNLKTKVNENSRYPEENKKFFSNFLNDILKTLEGETLTSDQKTWLLLAINPFLENKVRGEKENLSHAFSPRMRR